MVMQNSEIHTVRVDAGHAVLTNGQQSFPCISSRVLKLCGHSPSQFQLAALLGAAVSRARCKTVSGGRGLIV